MPLISPLANFSQDLRFGLRMLRKTPGFTATAILTLALGIGASTAMFSVVDSVLLRPLPFKDADHLVTVSNKDPHKGRTGYSAASLLDARDENRVFDNLPGWATAAFNVSGQGLPEQIDGMAVSWDFFKTLSVTPVLGRSFGPGDDRPGAPRVAVLSYGLWQRKFGGVPEAVGSSVTVNGEKCTVVGIMPQRFRFFHAPEMWMPLALNRATASPHVFYLSALARLKPGVSLAQATAQWGGLVEPLRAVAREGQPKGLPVLCGAVGFLLLIACVNVANLLLAKAPGRRLELAVRASLGADRPRLLRLLLTESVLLALAGGLLGSLLAFWVVRFLPVLVPPALLSGCAEIAVDWRVLGFTFTLSILTGLFFGVFPAWRASGPGLHEVLKAGGRNSSGGSGRMRGALVVAEVALSLVLLVCAGLLIRSLLAMQKVDLGFRPDHVLTMRLPTLEGRYPGSGPVRAFYRQVLERVGSIPGVHSVGISMGQAPWDSPDAGEFDIPGHPKAKASEGRFAVFETVSPDYFKTEGIRLRKGRFFDDRDNEAGQRAVIVNQTFVKLYMPKEEPLGQRLLVSDEAITGEKRSGPLPSWEIVGVVDDVKFGGPTANTAQFIYLPVMRSPSHQAALAVRTSLDPASLTGAVRAALAQIDPETPVMQVKTMDQIVVDSMSQPRTQTWLLGVFAAIALALAALGNYGVMSYSVAQSTRDMGIRLALGATSGDVLKLVLRKGLMLVCAGLVAGLAGALALTRLLSNMLFNVKATDPWTFASVSLLLASVALVAAYIPARRATRIDPAMAFRCE